jgi:hypothetical protein
MPYCRKCGAKLEEEARFCHVCGTPVAAVTVPAIPRRRSPFLFPVIILIAILVTAVVVGALVFLPFYHVHFDQTNQVAKAGVDNLLLDFQADVAQVNIFFRNLPDKMVVLNVTADGYVGIFDDPNRTINVTFNHQTTNNSEVVTYSVSRVSAWPLSYNLNVICDVYIDPSVNLSRLFVHSGVGQIVLNADTATTIQTLSLDTTTGSIEASLARGVVIAGSVSAKTTTGSVTFNWEQADTEGKVSVNLKSTTGAVNLSVSRNSRLSGNVSIDAGTTTGSVNLAMTIHDDVGAKIESRTSVGGIDVEQQGFLGNQSLLQSSNYPAGSNFLVNLATTTGSVNINAYYGSSAVLSAWQTR